jgi:hypothetical protein
MMSLFRPHMIYRCWNEDVLKVPQLLKPNKYITNKGRNKSCPFSRFAVAKAIMLSQPDQPNPAQSLKNKRRPPFLRKVE